MYYSYVMGMSKDIFKLKEEGFIIENDKNNYMISFSNDNIAAWEKYVIDNLANGFWNEYIGDKIVFIFKFKDGEVKKYVLDQNNHNEILELCCKFANTNFVSLKSMLLENKFYKDKLNNL